MSKDTSSQEYQDLKTELRSILISSKYGCTEEQLIRDYAAYNGKKEIPFRSMGYRSVMDLLQSMPDAARIDDRKKPITVHGVCDEQTAHIQNFVQNQKSAPRKGRYNPPYRGPSTTRHRNPTPFSSTWKQFPTGPVHLMSTNYMPRFLSSQPLTHVKTPIVESTTKTVASFGPRHVLPSAAIHPSSLDSNLNRATPVSPGHSLNNDDMKSIDDHDLIEFDNKTDSAFTQSAFLLRERIQQLLLEYPNGVWLRNIEKLYKKKFNEEIDFAALQLENSMDLLKLISDFVDSERDPRKESMDRLLSLKSELIDVGKPKQQNVIEIQNQKLTTAKTQTITIDYAEISPQTDSADLLSPLIDRSAFVPLDFVYCRLEYNTDQPFTGFLGEVNDPFTLSIGNAEFLHKREAMMNELQRHYAQYSDASSYIIPLDELKINLSCVYHDQSADRYYRVYISQWNWLDHNRDRLSISVYLVDYGVSINDIVYYPQSTTFKFLHREFSTLPTQIYDCRLANISNPTPHRWSSEACQLIRDHCENEQVMVQITGYIDTTYCIHLWAERNMEKSVNQILVESQFALEFDDQSYTEFKPVKSSQIVIDNGDFVHIEQSLSDRLSNDDVDSARENMMKHLTISIEHAYWFVKHPFTQRPCLPCFELARLLNVDDKLIPQLNLIRETKLRLNESTSDLFSALNQMTNFDICSHLHCLDSKASIYLYDLSAVRDHLLKNSFEDGDVIDAFAHEFNSYDRPGYWDETESSYDYQHENELDQEDQRSRYDLLAFRRDQILTSLDNTTTQDRIKDKLSLQNELESIEEAMHRISGVNDRNSKSKINGIYSKLARTKMRETRFRIARPFEQEFGLNVRFNHQKINFEGKETIEDLDERLEDLHRITLNCLRFTQMEVQLVNNEDLDFVEKIKQIVPDMIQNDSLDKRIETYHQCLLFVQLIQPIIESHERQSEIIEIN